MSEIIDISPTLSAAIAVWPGDVAFQRDVSLDMHGGDNLTLSAITTTVHLGAHTDAPNHYLRDGVGISERSLDYYYGPCQVIRADVAPSQRLARHHFSAAISAERVLFYTGSYPDPDNFNTNFCSFSPELVGELADAGVRLIGIDTPSVDPFDDKELQSHNVVAKNDMAVLEGIVLEHVPEGSYTLVALPLKLRDADASPVRAILIR